jgi:hypothetical protein
VGRGPGRGCRKRRSPRGVRCQPNRRPAEGESTSTGGWITGPSYGSGNFKLLPPAVVAWGSEIFLACLAKDGTLYYSTAALDPGPETGLTIFMDSIDGGESTLDAPPAVVAQTSPIKLLRILVNTGDGIKLNQRINPSVWPLPWETVGGGAISYISGPAASWRDPKISTLSLVPATACSGEVTGAIL